MYVICDTETEGLDNPKCLWLVVCKEIDTGRVHVFRNLHLEDGQRPDGLAAFLSFAAKVSVWVGHNFIDFDGKVLSSICGLRLDPSHVVDTLVCSRLLNYGIEGGHSLDAWGRRLGCLKSAFSDYSNYSKEMEDYCIQDVEVTHKLFQKVLPYIQDPGWKDSLRLEHDIAYLCNTLKENGFHFNKQKAEELLLEISLKVESLKEQLQTAFPPKSCLVREITPKTTKHGTLNRSDFRWSDGDLSAYSPGSPFSLIEFVPFNPGSPKQIVERLNEAGWYPYEKTKGHLLAERARSTAARTGKPTAAKAGGIPKTTDEWDEKLRNYKTYGWTISEANLNTLVKTAPKAARSLVQWLLLDSRRSTLTEWLNAYNEATGRIHGTFNGIGAWTHRMSHSNPNAGNIPSQPQAPKDREPTEAEKVALQYSGALRALWDVPKGRLLIGVDAESIQLRVLAHYMDDKKFTEALVSGEKSKGTDAHTLNKIALGDICPSRDHAKTFIYAWLLGAGTDKIAQILGCSSEEAREACEKFLDFYPGLRRLKDKRIPEDAERGYFSGLDKRLVKCDNKHLMLAGYLQNGESIIMKRANLLWIRQLTEARLPFWQVNFVHDEWQTETIGDPDTAKQIANIQADSIRQVGIDLGLRCPLAGSILNSHNELAINTNWSLTH